jgi:hypothetical protein
MAAGPSEFPVLQYWCRKSLCNLRSKPKPNFYVGPSPGPAAHAKPTQGTALVNRSAQNQLNRTSAPATTHWQMDHFAFSPPNRYQIAFLCIIPDCKMGIRGN